MSQQQALVLIDGVLYLEDRTPWCDCKPAKQGYRQRKDGCWVKPCCDRREKFMWDRYGDDTLIDPHRTLDELRSTLADLEEAERTFSSSGTKARVKAVRAEIKKRSVTERKAGKS